MTSEALSWIDQWIIVKLLERGIISEEKFNKMVSFPSDDEIRLKRIAEQNVDSDIAFLRLKSPEMSPEEEADTRKSLYRFHVSKLKGEI